MKLPTNITIELCQADPTKGHKGWHARVTWTDPTTGENRTALYSVADDCLMHVGLSDTLRFLAEDIESDIETLGEQET